MIRILQGDCRETLRILPDASVHCVVTSPPYYGLRDYQTGQWDGGDADCDHTYDRSLAGRASTLGGGKTTQIAASIYRECRCGARRIDSQIGLEPTPDAYLATMVAVFRELRRVLRDDGTCWVNMGDSYAGGAQYGAPRSGEYVGDGGKAPANVRNRNGVGAVPCAKPKDLLMMPARLALALQADGWWLRSDIIWHKPNPLPESCRDRPTSAHEHVFLLSKRARYYYDADAVREEPTGRTDPIRSFGVVPERNDTGNSYDLDGMKGRNMRNVWTIAPAPYKDAHFATYPPALAERCIKAGSRPGDTVLDPFAGAGTTALVADRLGRDCIGIELNPEYCAIARRRIEKDAGMFAEFAA